MATITGTAADDILEGTAAADTITGLGGNDLIRAGIGDNVDGGEGIDTIELDLRGATSGVQVYFVPFSNPQPVTLYGATITGIEVFGAVYLPDYINYFSIFDPLNTRGATVYGGSLNDSIVGANGDDRLYGGDGGDQLDGRWGNDLLDGGDGFDYFTPGHGHDQVFGGADLDILSFLDIDEAVVVDMGLHHATSANGVDTTFDSIESVYGTGHDDILVGDLDSNTFYGSLGADLIDGRGGDDTIDGGLGADTLQGGDGHDWILSGDDYAFTGLPSDHDVLSGGMGNDSLRFGLGDDADGGEGFDTAILSYLDLGTGVSIRLADILAGVAGANGGGTVTGVEGIEAIWGSDFNDTIDLTGQPTLRSDVFLGAVITGAGNDTLIGSAEGDYFEGGTDDDLLIGNAGDDYLDGGPGNDVLIGGAGSDTYYADSQADLIFELADDNPSSSDRVKAGGDFYLYANLEVLDLYDAEGDPFGVGNELDNLMIGNQGSNLLIGGGGNDTIYSQGGGDILYGQDGNDVLGGGAGSDFAAGGSGNDQLIGDDGVDFLYGEDGDDWLHGGDSFDTDLLVGGAGDDQIYARSQQPNPDYDLLYGGSGNDTYYVDTGDDLTFEDVDGGYDQVFANVTVAGAGVYLYANVEALILEGTTAFGVGNELDNSVVGSNSDNWLIGGAGNDRISGRGGNDVLFGDQAGGPYGADTFVFESGSGGDVIGDFRRGEDVIELHGYYTSFAVLQQHFIQNGADGAIDLGGGNFIVLNGVTMSELTAADIHLFG